MRGFVLSSNFFFSFLKKITSGKIEITADQFPNFLYDEQKADLPSKDEDWNVEDGLLSSPLCLWVRCNFLGSIRAHLETYRLTNVFSWAMDSGRLPRGRKNLRLVRLMG